MTFYRRTPNRVGGGSKTNLNGLSFEGRTSLIDSLNLHPNIEIKNNNEIHFNGVIVGYYFEKYNFYTDFIEKHNFGFVISCLSDLKIFLPKILDKKYNSEVVNRIKVFEKRNPIQEISNLINRLILID